MRFVRIVGLEKGGGGRPEARRPAGPKASSIPEISTPSDARPLREPSARPDKRPIRIATWVAGSLTLSALLFGYFLLGDRGWWELRRQRQRFANLQAEVSSLGAENARLTDEVARLKKDPAAAERVAREELNFVRPGEVVLVLPKGWMERMTKKAPEKKPTGAPSSSSPSTP